MGGDQEQDWIRAAAQGDLQAYGRLVHLHQDMVFSLSLSLLKNRQDAEDLSQDVLVKAYRMLPQFKGLAPFKGWLYRITYHEGLNRLKKINRQRSTLDLDDHAGDAATTTTNHLEEIEAADKRRMIRLALDHLPPEDRVLVHAYYFEEMSIREICMITGMSESNVKIKLYRSRKVMHEVLQKTWVDEQAR